VQLVQDQLEVIQKEFQDHLQFFHQLHQQVEVVAELTLLQLLLDQVLMEVQVEEVEKAHQQEQEIHHQLVHHKEILVERQ
jgi:hypothetical protein